MEYLDLNDFTLIRLKLLINLPRQITAHSSWVTIADS